MSVERAENLYKRLIETVKAFKSPAFRQYFLRTARSDYNAMKKEAKNGRDSVSAIKNYIDTQKGTLETMKRQTAIYNMFYDDSSNI